MFVRKRTFFQILSLGIILLSVPIGIFLLNSETGFFSRAFGKKAELIVNPGILSRDRNGTWKYLAQGGEETGRTFEPVLDDVRALEPNYIRIDHLYDFYSVVKRDPSGALVMDWSQFDAMIEDIRDTGARPFLSLSYMPDVLTDGNELSLPRDWNEWRDVVQNTIEHVSGRNGLAIENVYYEVWNEPDLFGDFKTYGDKNYLTLYEYAAIGAREAENVLPFKIGGPATTAFYPNWLENLTTYTQEKNLPLQFISWHVYSSDLDTYEKAIQDAQTVLANNPLYVNDEIFITESGYSSNNDEAFDSNLGAIQTIATVALAENTIDGLFTFEIKDGLGDKQYWGRWGLLTHEQFGTPERKIRYQALEFLNNMQGIGIDVLGEGTWVKSFAKLQEDGTISILIVNYDPYGKNVESVPLTLINMPFKRFQYTRHNFLGDTVSQIESIDGNTWETLEYLDPNTAAIITLKQI